MQQLECKVERIQTEVACDFTLSFGTVVPAVPCTSPHFLYTDIPILGNRYYPDGDKMVDLWRECLSYEQRWLHQATMVFTMSDFARRSFLEQYDLPPEKTICVQGGCNAPLPANDDSTRFDRQNILFIGVDWERKGGPTLVKAFAKVRKKYATATLTIVGCQPSVSGPGIEVAGFVLPAQVADYLAGATVFCMPSTREPFGIVYLEAMCAGLPIIACDLGAAPEFTIHGETGYRIQPDDVDMLAQRLQELLGNPERCRRMGERGRALVASEYTWEKTQQKMWQAIQRFVTP
jgi:glycosyltransferase involved in cell wall biosynthesis